MQVVKALGIFASHTFFMKICHVVDSMEVGGAEKIISLLCHWQRQHGHDPSVHCLYGIGSLGEELRQDGFEVLLHNPARLIGRATSVYNALKRSRPEVVHCHNATAAIVGVLPARLAGARSVIATRHGNVSRPYGLRRELKFAVASRWSDWIVAVCERARQNLMQAPFAARNKIVSVYNSALEPHMNGTPSPKKSGFTLLNVARLSPAKDQETLLRAFALASARNPNLRLWIVGGGVLREKLEGAARQLGLNGNVTFFGEQANVARFLSAADLFVLSSMTEGIPLSLLEALAAGVPSVVTEVGGMSEVARLSPATMLVPPSNPQALSAAIERIVETSDQLPHLKTIARQCYSEHFTLDRMAGEYMALYNNVRS